ncbi:AtpZ/AtpI family protein [Candidatus Gottesmanbacteria bacterium]|nr:AtpZ/AtpI family protein [Candidatus Gottesmanbacteria bacterium]
MKIEKRKKQIRLDVPQGYITEEKSEKKIHQKLPLPVLMQAAEIGFTIALPITLGALFGLWLDNRLMTHPKLTLSFLVIGIIVAFTNLFTVIKKFTDKGK